MKQIKPYYFDVCCFLSLQISEDKCSNEWNANIVLKEIIKPK